MSSRLPSLTSCVLPLQNHFYFGLDTLAVHVTSELFIILTTVEACPPELNITIGIRCLPYAPLLLLSEHPLLCAFDSTSFLVVCDEIFTLSRECLIIQAEKQANSGATIL